MIGPVFFTLRPADDLRAQLVSGIKRDEAAYVARVARSLKS
jgi:hypothetical protein